MFEKNYKDSNLLGLIIGINKYSNEYINDLKYAVRDAIRIYHFLKFRWKGKVKLKLLLNPNGADILKSLDTLSREFGKWDTFIFYFAGHGCLINGKPYILPHDAIYNINHQKLMEKNAIDWDVIIETIEELKSNQKIIVLDSCRSEIIKSEASPRGISSEVVDFADQVISRDVLGVIKKNDTSFAILVGTTDRDRALEVRKYRSGLFTYSLIKTLENQSSDVKLDQSILKEIKNKIKELSGGQIFQKPELKIKGNPPILYIRPKNASIRIFERISNSIFFYKWVYLLRQMRKTVYVTLFVLFFSIVLIVVLLRGMGGKGPDGRFKQLVQKTVPSPSSQPSSRVEEPPVKNLKFEKPSISISIVPPKEIYKNYEVVDLVISLEGNFQNHHLYVFNLSSDKFKYVFGIPNITKSLVRKKIELSTNSKKATQQEFLVICTRIPFDDMCLTYRPQPKEILLNSLRELSKQQFYAKSKFTYTIMPSSIGIEY